ncbi:hypothetical protein TNCV_2695901 [Trichonephila clavipes]|nr:hypothetical protein TNCV_2695901 [Trichonephila clavipes]
MHRLHLKIDDTKSMPTMKGEHTGTNESETDVLFAAESPTIAGQGNNPVEARDMRGCLKSQLRAIVERADHRHLFVPSIGVWGKIHLYD